MKLLNKISVYKHLFISSMLSTHFQTAAHLPHALLTASHVVTKCGPLTFKVRPTQLEYAAHALAKCGPRTRKMRPTHHTLTCKVRGPYLPRTTAAVLTAWRATAWKRPGSKRVNSQNFKVFLNSYEKIIIFHFYAFQPRLQLVWFRKSMLNNRQTDKYIYTRAYAVII